MSRASALMSELPKAPPPPWVGSLLTRCRAGIQLVRLVRLVRLAMVQLMARVRVVNCSCAVQAC